MTDAVQAADDDPVLQDKNTKALVRVSSTESETPAAAVRVIASRDRCSHCVEIVHLTYYICHGHIIWVILILTGIHTSVSFTLLNTCFSNFFWLPAITLKSCRCRY